MTLSRRSLLATTAAAAAGAAVPAAASRRPGAGPRAAHRVRAAGRRRLRPAGRPEGRRRHQPDRDHPRRPAHRGRDARGRPGEPDRRLRPRARLPGHRPGGRLGGPVRRPGDRAAGLRHVPEERQPLADVFTASGVDTVVFDIQDAGARFYTYIWTLYDCMEAAALAGKRFVVLDRPNPVTGRAALGPVLHKEFATFVGRRPIAQAHGMTVAELARLFNGEFLPTPVPLETVTMTGWRRGSSSTPRGLPWVPPSPNMPTPETALVYSGTCLFEGTNLSEGRGTTRPFELLGAEGIDGRWAEAANELGLPGVRFREAYFAPTFSKFAGKTVGGRPAPCARPGGLRPGAHRDRAAGDGASGCGTASPGGRTTGSTSSPGSDAGAHDDRRGRRTRRGGGRPGSGSWRRSAGSGRSTWSTAERGGPREGPPPSSGQRCEVNSTTCW